MLLDVLDKREMKELVEKYRIAPDGWLERLELKCEWFPGVSMACRVVRRFML